MDIFVSSFYRQSQQNRFDFDVRLTQNYNNGKKKQSVKLVSTSIPLTGYQFNSSAYQFTIQEQSPLLSQTITLPQSNMDSDTAGPIIEALIAASTLAGVYSVTFDDLASKMTISSSVNFRLIWPQTRLAYYWGFNSTTTSYALTHSSDFAFNFTAPGHLFLKINGLPTIDVPESMPVSGSFCIPTGSNTGFYQSQESGSVKIPDSGLPSTLRVSLYNEFGEFYEIQSDWSFTLRVISE